MANAFLLDAVEAACMDHLNSRKFQLSLPEIVVIFNTIGAESAKVFFVFRKNLNKFALFPLAKCYQTGQNGNGWRPRPVLPRTEGCSPFVWRLGGHQEDVQRSARMQSLMRLNSFSL